MKNTTQYSLEKDTLTNALCNNRPNTCLPSAWHTTHQQSSNLFLCEGRRWILSSCPKTPVFSLKILAIVPWSILRDRFLAFPERAAPHKLLGEKDDSLEDFCSDCRILSFLGCFDSVLEQIGIDLAFGLLKRFSCFHPFHSCKWMAISVYAIRE